MNKINPKLTQNFLEDIKNQSADILEVEGIKIKTCKNVFPPKSNFSRSSEKLHMIFGDLKNLTILDMGTGTGVQAIQAVSQGAKKVVAVDISKEAVDCAKENVLMNHVADRVVVFQSDLFSNIDDEMMFDVVIGNLPITDYPMMGVAEATLYDPNYEIHKRFLLDAKKHLTEKGIIVITHIDFNGQNDFIDFEKMLKEYGYGVERFIEIEDLGYHWRMCRVVVLRP